jgi:hypothetical protein
MVRILSDLHEHYFGIIRLPDPQKTQDVTRRGVELFKLQ